MPQPPLIIFFALLRGDLFRLSVCPRQQFATWTLLHGGLEDSQNAGADAHSLPASRPGPPPPPVARAGRRLGRHGRRNARRDRRVVKRKTYQRKLEESARMGEQVIAAAQRTVRAYRRFQTLTELEASMDELQALVGNGVREEDANGRDADRHDDRRHSVSRADRGAGGGKNGAQRAD